MISGIASKSTRHATRKVGHARHRLLNTQYNITQYDMI